MSRALQLVIIATLQTTLGLLCRNYNKGRSYIYCGIKLLLCTVDQWRTEQNMNWYAMSTCYSLQTETSRRSTTQWAPHMPFLSSVCPPHGGTVVKRRRGINVMYDQFMSGSGHRIQTVWISYYYFEGKWILGSFGPFYPFIRMIIWTRKQYHCSSGMWWLLA